MSDLDVLISDILCHVNEDGLKLSKTELHDLMTRLMQINESTNKLRDIISKPLVSLIDDFEFVQLQKAQGE